MRDVKIVFGILEPLKSHANAVAGRQVSRPVLNLIIRKITGLANVGMIKVAEFFWSAVAQFARMLGELAARHLPAPVERRTIIDDLRESGIR